MTRSLRKILTLRSTGILPLSSVDRSRAGCPCYLVILLCALFVAPALANEPPEQDEGFDPAKIVSDEALRAMYQRELGSRYKPALFEKLKAAHLLVEEYFATPSSKERADLTKQIDGIGLDPNFVGRITRIRIDWPALEGGGVYYINERLGPHQVRYFLGVPPKYDHTQPWPMVVKLPTVDAFIAKPPLSAEQVARIYGDWIEEELRQHPDALVLMPLLNFDELYGPSYDGMNSVFQPIRHAYERVNLDPARVYLIGHSMAGQAAWNIVLHYPTYFAAFNSLAGAALGDWQRLRMMNLRNVLPVVWHDVDDKVLKVNFSRQIVKALRQMKLDVEYEETKGIGHAPTAEVAERAYEKTLARVRELYPPEVYLQSNRPDSMFNRIDWVQVYQPARPGKDQRLLFRHGTGFMIVTENAWSVQAARTKKNRLEAVSRNVAVMRFYVNDQMVDFREPVTVIVNKKPQFEGMLKPSLETMLKDQVSLGRGWRYHTAAIDIDLAPPPVKPPPKAAPKKPKPGK